MPYRVLADGIAVTHLLFLLYVTFGGFVAWRWPWTIGVHVLAVAWGFSTVLVGIDCPLTYAENWARHRAGEAGLPPSGFIAHYLTGVIYPESAVGLIRALVAVCIAVSWAGLWWRHIRRVRYDASGFTRQ